MKINSETDALIVVDMLNDFMPWGTLPVPGADEIVDDINEFSREFKTIVLLRDQHDFNHCSFFENGGPFPKHCVTDTEGGDFAAMLFETISRATMILSKGMDKDVESFSGLVDARGNESGLRGFLLNRGIKRVFLVGVAFEYCVQANAIDAVSDFEVFVMNKMVRGITPEGVERSREVLKNCDVKVLD